MLEIREDDGFLKVEGCNPIEFGNEELCVNFKWKGGELNQIRVRTPYGDHEYLIEDTGKLVLLKGKVYEKYPSNTEKY